MGSEWRETTLGEFAPFNYGKGLPKRKRNPEGGIPVYGSNGITGYHDEALVEKGIIIGRKGSIGEVEFSEKPFWPIDTTFYVEESPERDIRFTYYLLKSLPLQEMNSDSAVPGLNRNAAYSLKIKVPDLEEQKRIAHILGTLDDKIELNQRMNETLEAIARAIFKSWFVDFDPVKAKMAGEPYPLPDTVMALFPDALVESELGMIPKGWEVSTFKDITKTKYGYTAKAINYEIGPKFLRITDIVSKSINWGDVPYCEIEEKNLEKYLLKEGDVVVARTGATVGYAKLIGELHPKSVFASYLVRLRPKSSIHKYIIGISVESKKFKKFIQLNKTGSAQPQANARIISSYPIVLPPNGILIKFNKFIGKLLKRRELLEQEMSTLSKLRETSLPKMMWSN